MTALLATVIFALSVQGTAARNFSFSSPTFRASFADFRFAFGEIALSCRLTLEGAYHSRTIAKVREALIGVVTAVTVAHPCQGGELFAFNGVERTPNTLPWHLQYESFEGTLPSNIGSITQILSRFRFLMQIPLICAASYGSETDRVFTRLNLFGGIATTIEPIAGRNVSTRVTTLSGICPATVGGTGPGNVTVLNGTARITVTLI
ncbi:MAG: hypothetical protein ACTHOE_11415 [Conexibacter sp.]